MVFMVLVQLKMAGARTDSECAAVFVLFVVSTQPGKHQQAAEHYDVKMLGKSGRARMMQRIVLKREEAYA